MRAAVAAYDDATVGHPDDAAQQRAGEALRLAHEAIRKGSQRLALEDLGHAVGAPDPGRSAMLAGDRRTLLGRADTWEDWSVQLRALEAALLEGSAARAGTLARRYADFDPHDEDLRVAVAAILCLTGEPRRGVDLLFLVQTERARQRHESWARNWGEVRAALVACAAKAGVPPPPLPERAEGGEGDQPEARAALRLRIRARGAVDAAARRAAALDAIQLLESDPLPPGARVRVLAALLASGHAREPRGWARAAPPRRRRGASPAGGARPHGNRLARRTAGDTAIAHKGGPPRRR
jgi:hypothetical protein